MGMRLHGLAIISALLLLSVTSRAEVINSLNRPVSLVGWSDGSFTATIENVLNFPMRTTCEDLIDTVLSRHGLGTSKKRSNSVADSLMEKDEKRGLTLGWVKSKVAESFPNNDRYDTFVRALVDGKDQYIVDVQEHIKLWDNSGGFTYEYNKRNTKFEYKRTQFVAEVVDGRCQLTAIDVSYGKPGLFVPADDESVSRQKCMLKEAKVDKTTGKKEFVRQANSALCEEFLRAFKLQDVPVVPEPARQPEINRRAIQ